MFTKYVASVAIALGCIAAVADTIEFKSGARLTGSVVRMVGTDVIFNSDDVGEVKVPADKIKSLVTEKKNVVQYQDNTTEEAVVGIKDGQIVVSGEEIEQKDFKALNPEVEKWHGSVNLSASAARGNTVSESATLLADVNRRWEKDRFLANFGYYYSQQGTTKENKEKTTDRVELFAQEDHFWANKVYSYLNAKYERDGINLLHHRYQIGLGVGYQWLDGYNHESTGVWSFKQEAGAAYAIEKYEHQKGEEYASFRYSHHLEWKPRWVSGLAVFHNFEYLPNTEDWAEDYRIETDLGFTKDLVNGWQLIGKMEWDYDSLPAESAKHSDMRYMLGIGYKW